MVRSYGAESNQYSNEECSTCCQSSTSTITKDYSNATKCGNENEDEIQDISMEECPSCKTNNSRSSSQHDANREWGVMTDVDYEYPQWQWLGRQNSYRSREAHSTRQSEERNNHRMNLCDILPPPPYER